MLFTAVYLANLLCTFYNCQYLRPAPVTSAENSDVMQLTNRVGRSYEAPDPIVNTTQGMVEGYMMGVLRRKIYAFEGIPYAEKPEIFADPVPKRRWSGVRSAKKISNECMQFNLPRSFRVFGELDCLQLNIYTPQIPSGDYNPKFAVLIFIHGGSFILGRAADYGPSYLLQENIILVTMNYRVGVMGFLSTGDEEGLGNWGLKDQALSIQWIYDNIQAFGGDKTKISISGQSAGATCAHLHMMSTTSVARGLYRNAIAFSGSAAHSWALQTPQQARKITHHFAKRLGCPTNDGSKALLDCLRRVEPNFLVASQNNLIEFFGFPAVLFAPVIEPNVTGAYLTESTESAYANGNVAKIPFLCTNTAEEGEYVLMIMKNALVLGHLIRNWEARAPLILDIRDYVSNPGKAVSEIRDVYLRNVPPQYRLAVLDSNVKRYAQIGTDRYFTIGNRRALKLHGDHAPTYSYLFKFKSHLGIASFLSTDYKKWGASHGEDMTILFNNTAFSPPIKVDEKVYEMSKMLISLIANFATHNVPYYTSSNGTLVEIWNTIGDPERPMFLEIGNDGVQMVSDPMYGTEELAIWSKLGIK